MLSISAPTRSQVLSNVEAALHVDRSVREQRRGHRYPADVGKYAEVANRSCAWVVAKRNRDVAVPGLATGMIMNDPFRQCHCAGTVDDIAFIGRPNIRYTSYLVRSLAPHRVAELSVARRANTNQHLTNTRRKMRPHALNTLKMHVHRGIQLALGQYFTDVAEQSFGSQNPL